eukprot:363490-Chlamydomonas_euryale.AAC.5
MVQQHRSPAAQVLTADAHGRSALLEAAMYGRFRLIRQLLQHEPSLQVLHQIGMLGQTLLMYAAKQGLLHRVHLLLQH